MKKAQYTVHALLVAIFLSFAFGAMAFAQTNIQEVDGSLQTKSFESLQTPEKDEREVQAIQRVMREKNVERATPTMEESRKAVIVEKRKQTTVTGISTQKVISNIKDVSKSINEINTKSAETQRELFQEVRNEILNEIGTQIQEELPDNFFVDVEEDLKETVRAIQTDINARVQSVGSGGEPTRADLENRIDTRINELEARINTEISEPVKLERSRTAVRERVANLEESVTDFKKRLEKKDGFSLYRDSDNDGLSDYDEAHIYGTDPLQAFTAGSELTDGERVLQGLNPLDTSDVQVAIEDPREKGTVVRDLFSVRDVRVTKTTERIRPVRSADEVSDPSGATETVIDAEEIVFTGRALPNSIVTLYIFSTPIVVTVKADAAGEWTYTLDQELEDGDHEVFVASVDTTGRILAKSEAIPFVKTAAAVEFVSNDTLGAATPLSEGFLTRNFLLIASILLVLVILGALALIGMKSDDEDDSTIPPADSSPTPPEVPAPTA